MRNKLFWIGAALVACLVMCALFAPWLSPFDPLSIDLQHSFMPPGGSHIMGTDAQGADILSRIIYGSRVSVLVGVFAVGISLIIGVAVGSVAGYYGGIIDTLAMRTVDVFLAFPSILLAIAVAALLGPGLFNVVFAISFFSWVTYARLVRAKFMSLKESDFVQAAKCAGTGDFEIIFKHILPHTAAPVIVQASFGLAAAILSESSLSFLGLGVPPDVPSWGGMLSQGTRYLTIAPHLSIFPGAAIMLAVLGFNFLGDGLRDKLDVKR